MTRKKWSHADSPTSVNTGKIKEVSRMEDGYELSYEPHYGCWLMDDDNPKKLVPKVGDELNVYCKQGSKIIGMMLNGEMVFLKSNEQLDKEHEEWREAVKVEHTKEHYDLMEKIKDEEPFETIDVTGFGSVYEHGVQMMIRAGMKWLEKHPDFKFVIDQHPNIMGVATLEGDNKLLKSLDKALLAANEGCSGFQHQVVVNHLKYIHENGYQKWLDEFPKDRHYMYPKELPVDHFMKEDDDND